MKDTVHPSSPFMEGLKDGFPICLGYFSVGFAFGITVIGEGFPPWIAVLISMTNLTSAGQLAGLAVLAGGGSLIEMCMTQLVINLRYALMSFSLTQKLSEKFRLLDRFIVSMVITDEIFAVAASHPGKVSRSYMFGLAAVPITGWVIGTWLGAVAGGILPAVLVSALGIAIYGMFIAIVVPAARELRGILNVVVFSILLSCILHYTPILSRMSEGFMIIISAVAASLAGALLWPLDLKEDE